MDVMERIRAQIEGHPIVLYMKGTPQFPMCGFSARVVQILQASGASFYHVNVLEDPEIRQSLPRYANWPTFPQLYVHGELIGGCDIVSDLFERGELGQILTPAGSA